MLKKSIFISLALALLGVLFSFLILHNAETVLKFFESPLSAYFAGMKSSVIFWNPFLFIFIISTFSICTYFLHNHKILCVFAGILVILSLFLFAQVNSVTVINMLSALFKIVKAGVL